MFHRDDERARRTDDETTPTSHMFLHRSSRDHETGPPGLLILVLQGPLVLAPKDPRVTDTGGPPERLTLGALQGPQVLAPKGP